MTAYFKRIPTKNGTYLPLPKRATEGSVGFDLRASLDEPITLPGGESGSIPTGVALRPPEGAAAFVFARSGLSIKHGVTLANGVGVIDPDYRGEIYVGLVNLSGRDYVISPGDRIAQLCFFPALFPTCEEVPDLDGTDRGAGGLGSTGK